MSETVWPPKHWREKERRKAINRATTMLQHGVPVDLAMGAAAEKRLLDLGKLRLRLYLRMLHYTQTLPATMPPRVKISRKYRAVSIGAYCYEVVRSLPMHEVRQRLREKRARSSSEGKG